MSKVVAAFGWIIAGHGGAKVVRRIGLQQAKQGGDDVPPLQGHPGLSDASKGTGVPESRGEVGVQDPEHHDGARDTRWRDDRMTGRRSHGRLSALNGVVHQGRSAPTVKQHLAAIRMLGDWLVVSQVLPVNPAAAVRGPKHVVTTGQSPVLAPAEARRLLEAIDTGTLAGRRDRALVSVMLYSFARVSAVIGMRRHDYFRQERQGWLRLHEKGGQRHDVPAHHRAAEALDDYLSRAGLDEATAALFQSVDPAGRRLTGRALSRRLVLAMIKRRAAAAGLPPSTCCHTFRATGITAYLSNGGTLEHAQQIAGHASPKTTKLYDRTADTITVDEIERIVI